MSEKVSVGHPPVETPGSFADTDLTLEALAVQEIRAADGIVAIAAAALVRRLESDTALRTAVLADLCTSAAQEACRHVRSADRETIWNRPGPDVQQRHRNGLLAVASTTLTTLLDFPLFGGHRLGDATADEVAASAQRYLTLAQTHSSKGRWLDLVAKRTPAGKRVREALTADALQKLRDEVEAS